jgi:hypothetical protein
MDAARVKALEFALVAIQCGLPVNDPAGLLAVAEVFRAWIDPPRDKVSPADGDDYPRLQPDPAVYPTIIPSRY